MTREHGPKKAGYDEIELKWFCRTDENAAHTETFIKYVVFDS